MTEDRRTAADAAAFADGRDAHIAASAIASFRQLLAPLRTFDAPHVRPAVVPDVPRGPPLSSG